MVMELSKEISLAKFNKFHRKIFAIYSSNSATSYYLTKNSAYEKMERIKKQLESIGALVECNLHDLDARPVYLLTEAGSVYSLLTLSIEY